MSKPRVRRTPQSASVEHGTLRTAPSGEAAASALPTSGWKFGVRALRLSAPRPELVLLAALVATLNLWGLSGNQWANQYYSAAVRSMSTSWHNFLFGSLDAHGLMTVDKPPLALWVQSLSVRVFGFHPLSMLMPQALMGVASVALVYDLVQRRFGRPAGFVSGLALATTPITVAISRHNNPDALLVLCCVGAVWFAVRALEDGRTRWLVLAGACIGLGFETKMGVALMVVPGIVAAWLWVAPRGRIAALRQLLAGGVAMVATGAAWPLLVALTPAGQRPWISGTSDNSILSLILDYNGLGRLDGQAGGPAGIGGGAFGGSAGPLRLLNSALGGQDGWLLGFAVVCGAAALIATRARRTDPRTGWILTVGGTFVTVAVAFSAARGIFHPYYVAELAPFAAALVGVGVSVLGTRGRSARVVGPLAFIAGVLTEVAVLRDYPGQLAWLQPVLIVVGALCVIALAALASPRLRAAAVTVGVATLLLGPSIWAADTLGYAASGTFPAGGPSSAADSGGPGGGLGGPAGVGRPRGQRRFPGSNGRPPASGGGAPGAFRPPGGAPRGGTPPPSGLAGLPGRGPAGGLRGLGGGQFGADGSLTQVLRYTRQHGGGTVAVASQSSAATAIISQGADVAGIGGFSGRESQVSVAWLAQEVRAGRVRWVVAGGNRGSAPGMPGDTRNGAASAMLAATAACRSVTVASTSSSGQRSTAVYDCQGRAGALQAYAARRA
jgi:4-amino-4-deoxy-L-arabinose transferase-like glycosyltransferase